MRVFSFSLHDENLVGVLEGKLQVWGSPLGSLTLEMYALSLQQLVGPSCYFPVLVLVLLDISALASCDL